MENKHNEAENISLRLQEQNEVLMKIYGKLRSEWRQLHISRSADNQKFILNDDEEIDED